MKCENRYNKQNMMKNQKKNEHILFGEMNGKRFTKEVILILALKEE